MMTRVFVAITLVCTLYLVFDSTTFFIKSTFQDQNMKQVKSSIYLMLPLLCCSFCRETKAHMYNSTSNMWTIQPKSMLQAPYTIKTFSCSEHIIGQYTGIVTNPLTSVISQYLYYRFMWSSFCALKEIRTGQYNLQNQQVYVSLRKEHGPILLRWTLVIHLVNPSFCPLGLATSATPSMTSISCG